MPPITNQMINARREKDCRAISTERKYFKVGQSWVKRSLRPREWQVNPMSGALLVPKFSMERIKNEGASMDFIAKNTNIPVPKMHSCFEDDEAVYLVMEFVEGITMAELDMEQRKIVEMELEGHLETMRNLKSRIWGGPSGIVIPPYRVLTKSPRPIWEMKPRDTKDLVFCHNDLSTHNVIVDPETLKVNAILDWEYAGFFPREFEGMYFRRPGPSVALGDEPHDEDSLLNILKANCLPL